MLDRIASLFERIAGIAHSLQRKLGWFLLFALLALVILALDLVALDASWWWNSLVLAVLAVPWLVWGFIWIVLGQLQDAPDLASNILKDQDGVLANLDDFNIREPNGLRGLASTIKQFRQHDGFETVFDTISGIGLLINPVFLIVALLLFFGLLGLLLLTPILLFLF